MPNKLEPEDIEWIFISCMKMTDCSHQLHRCDEYGIQKECIVNFSERTGNYSRNPKTYFYIDGCDKEMTDIDDLCDTWNDLKNFDDPDNKIVWERKVVPTIPLKEYDTLKNYFEREREERTGCPVITMPPLQQI